MNKPIVILLLLIFGLVFWLQYHSELYHLFLGSLGTSYIFAFGMVAKGHNHGLCQKCGKEHVHGMTGKHHSTETKEKISKANSGHSTTPETRLKQSLVKKGKPLSPSHYAHVVEANRSPSKRLAQSLTNLTQFLHGRVSGRKGKTNSLAHRLHIGEGLRQSTCWLKNVRAYHVEKNREEVRQWYSLDEDVIFFPVTLHEHKFSRLVLINGRVSSGLMTQSGMREIPEEVTFPLLEEVKCNG